MRPLAAGNPGARIGALTMTYRTHFPDFPPADFPADLPDGFVDSSWHDDVTPSIENEALGLRVWIFHADRAQRDYPAGAPHRYVLWDTGSGEIIISGNSWPGILGAIDHLVRENEAIERRDLEERRSGRWDDKGGKP